MKAFSSRITTGIIQQVLLLIIVCLLHWRIVGDVYVCVTFQLMVWVERTQ